MMLHCIKRADNADVFKGVTNMVLTDDNFATISLARAKRKNCIYDSIRKEIAFSSS